MTSFQMSQEYKEVVDASMMDGTALPDHLETLLFLYSPRVNFAPINNDNTLDGTQEITYDEPLSNTYLAQRPR